MTSTIFRRVLLASASVFVALTFTGCSVSSGLPDSFTAGTELTPSGTPRPVTRVPLQGSDAAYITSVDGGIHSEHALNPSDRATIREIRSRFQTLAAQLRSGDLAGFRTGGVIGRELLTAGSFTVTYHEIGAGASIVFNATDPAVVDALHALFSVQRGRSPKPAPAPTAETVDPIPSPPPAPESTGDTQPLPDDGGR